jgi:hypothetical protein
MTILFDKTSILIEFQIMVISFVQILQESFSTLLPSGDHTLAALPPLAIGAMAGTIGLKGLIWIICIPIKTTQVQALAQGMQIKINLAHY